jgi:AcrR family transcriptional regulator
MSRRDTKELILRAALAVFSRLGYEAATIADICAASGASNGSVFHHFGSKEGIAAALYLDGIRRYQAGLLAVLQRRAAAAGVRAAVRYHLDWVAAHRDLARFLFDIGRPDWHGARSADLLAANDAFAAGVARWLEPQVAAGRVKPLGSSLFAACVIGPVQFVSRGWIAGLRPAPAAAEAAALADAAWDAVAARKGRAG